MTEPFDSFDEFDEPVRVVKVAPHIVDVHGTSDNKDILPPLEPEQPKKRGRAKKKVDEPVEIPASVPALEE